MPRYRIGNNRRGRRIEHRSEDQERLERNLARKYLRITARPRGNIIDSLDKLTIRIKY